MVVALRLGLPFRAPRIELLVDSPTVDELLDRAARAADVPRGEPLLISLGRIRDEVSLDGGGGEGDVGPRGEEHPGEATQAAADVHTHAARLGAAAARVVATALLGWAVGHPDLESLRVAIAATRARLAELRRDDAPLTLATAHATKGLEFDHVVVIGMEAGRFPSARAVAEAGEPVRAYEEERRLAYVAWTRARRSLTLVYDPAVPSPFLLEAFTHEELGLDARMRS